MTALKSVIAIAVSCFLATLLLSAGALECRADDEGLTVGIYDSRAITVAFAHSNIHNEIHKDFKAEYDKAKEAGKEERVKEMEAQAEAKQHLFHQQGFGSAPVHDILEHIKDKIPGVAREAGVDIIVSKWELIYESPSAEFVDVTDLMVQLFDPDERVLSIVEDMRDKDPIPLDEIQKHDDH